MVCVLAKVHIIHETMAPINVVPSPPVSPRPQTPPSTPELAQYKQTLSSEHVQLFVDLLKAAQAIQIAPAATGAGQLASDGEKFGDRKSPRTRASKPKFKTVNEMYVHCEAQVQKR